MKIIFVTGFHRAGSNSATRSIAQREKLPFINEDKIRWDSWEAVECLCSGMWPTWKATPDGWIIKPVKMEKLKDGFVLHCPGLAHKTLELAKLGEVFWCDREVLNLVTAMRNGLPHDMVWHLMKGFKTEFPNDPVWETLMYDGREDVHDGFVRYFKLFVEVKKYFYEKYFTDKVRLMKLEDREDHDKSITLTAKKPLKPRELKAFESICLHKD